VKSKALQTAVSAGTVRFVAEELGAWDRFLAGVRVRLEKGAAEALIHRVASLPVKPSRATGSLGAYVFRGREPICVRLQFRQETELLKETILHELAHACDHLTRHPGEPYRRAHGKPWRTWAQALGIDPSRTAHSQVLHELRESRLKVVAVCQKCGFEFRRLRYLNKKQRKRQWVHPACGNGQVLAVK